MALTRCAAMEAAPAGVRVNCVAPSLATHPFLSKVMPQDLLDELETREAFGRGAEPWEVANSDRVPRERLRLLPDRRGRLRQQPAPLSAGRRSPMPTVFKSPAELASAIGKPLGKSEWLDDHPGADRSLRRGDRRPPVDPRRSGARGAGALRQDHRARLPHAVAGELLPAPDRRGARHLDGDQLRRRPPALSRAGAGRLARARQRGADRGRDAEGRLRAGEDPRHASRSRAASAPAA